jgi:Family of unknown function (DUF5719)
VPPATLTVVDPTFPTRGDQRLVVSNPSDRETLVHVRLLDAGGEFTPAGRPDLRIPPGSVTDVPLPQPTTRSAAVRLTSTTAVVAATVSVEHAAPDFAVAAASPPLSDRAVVPVIPGTQMSLRFVTTEAASATATVAAYDDSGSRLSRDVIDTHGRAVTEARLHDNVHAAFLVVSVGAAKHAARAVADYSSADGITALAVLPGRYRVTRPAVRALLSPS